MLRTLGDFVAGIPERLADRPRITAALILLLLVSLLWSGWRIVKPRDVNPLQLFGAVTTSDFDDYFQASQRFAEGGGDPYRMDAMRDAMDMMQTPEDLQNPLKVMQALEGLKGIGTYLYPPFTAWSLLPLTSLEYPAAAAVFQIVSILAFVAFLLLLYRMHRPGAAWLPDRDDAPYLLAVLFALIVLYRFLQSNMTNGNIGFFIIFLSGGGLLLAFRGGVLREFLGGCMMGVAVVMKITPAFFGLVLIGGRRVVAILGMGCGALGALLVPATSLGWSRNLELLHNWYLLILKTFSEVAFVRPWINNQSIAGGIGKLFIPGSEVKQGRFGLPLYSVNSEEGVAQFADLVSSANMALYVFALILALTVAGRALLRERSILLMYRERKLSELFSLNEWRVLLIAILVSLVGAGVSWYHAYCVVLIALAWRLYAHFAGSLPLRAGSDGLWFGVFVFFGVLQSVLPTTAREWLAIYSIFAWLCVIIVMEQGLRILLGRAEGRAFAP